MQQEPYLSEIQDPELREVSAISYWIKIISQYLGAASLSFYVATAVDDKETDPVLLPAKLESATDNIPGTIEPADPAVLLFEE